MVMLIVGGETLRDAVATEPFLPPIRAIQEAKKRYLEQTGQRASRLYLTEPDMRCLAETPDFKGLMIYVVPGMFLRPGIPRVVLGLEVIPLDDCIPEREALVWVLDEATCVPTSVWDAFEYVAGILEPVALEFVYNGA